MIRSRDVIFHDTIFPYKSSLSVPPSSPVTVDVLRTWPVHPCQQTGPRIGLSAPSDRRLTASIHNPDNALPPRLVPLPDSNDEDITSPPASMLAPLSSGDAPLPQTHSEHPESAPEGVPASRRSSRLTGLSTAPPAPPPQPRQSSRKSTQPQRLGNWAKLSDLSDDVDVPKTWRQLLKSPNKAKWLKAADEEFSSLVGMDTWKLVPRPDKRKIIRCKWIFKAKRRPDKTISRLKARLVAMGFTQEKGIDYDEVFAPTTRIETLRLVLSLLGAKRWSGYQVDFKSAFLNGSLDHTIYMSQPPGFEDPDHPDWVCEVTGSIYGLKQSPRQWNKNLHALLIDVGLTQSQFDPTLYFLIVEGKLKCVVAVHVDDLAVIGEEAIIQPLMDKFAAKYSVGAREPLHHFLSLRITWDVAQGCVFLSQEHYINDLKDQFLPNTFPLPRTPTSSTFKDLSPRLPNEDIASGPYASLVGALLWVAQCTRADVSFAVSKLSQFLCDPSDSHWQAASRVLAYLVNTKSLKLRLGGNVTCSGYSDSDWAEDRVDRRSTSAYTYRIGDGSVSWKTRKQPTVSLSSTEAEYKALSDSCKEALWLRNLLSELCLRPRSAIPLHVDNEGAECLARNPEHHNRTKHIDARYHFIRECVHHDLVSVKHVSTKDMIADMLTKPLDRVMLERHRGMFGIVE